MSNPRPPQRRGLTFASTVAVMYVLSRLDMTESELRSSWYDPDELEHMQSQLVDAVRAMRKNELHRDDPNHRESVVDTRGIEHMKSPTAIKERRNIMLDVVDAVLDEQDLARRRRARQARRRPLRCTDEEWRQWEREEDIRDEIDAEEIAEAARDASAPARDQALTRGVMDAAVAASATHDDVRCDPAAARVRALWSTSSLTAAARAGPTGCCSGPQQALATSNERSSPLPPPPSLGCDAAGSPDVGGGGFMNTRPKEPTLRDGHQHEDQHANRACKSALDLALEIVQARPTPATADASIAKNIDNEDQGSLLPKSNETNKQGGQTRKLRDIIMSLGRSGSNSPPQANNSSPSSGKHITGCPVTSPQFSPPTGLASFDALAGSNWTKGLGDGTTSRLCLPSSIVNVVGEGVGAGGVESWGTSSRSSSAHS